MSMQSHPRLSKWRGQNVAEEFVGPAVLGGLIGLLTQMLAFAELGFPFFRRVWASALLVILSFYGSLWVAWLCTRPVKSGKWRYGALLIATFVSICVFSALFFGVPEILGPPRTIGGLLIAWWVDYFVAVFVGLLALRALRPDEISPLARTRIRKRRGAGECLKCGYNLEGNVSGVCSECGEPT